jgi:aspartate racemase
VLDSSRRTIVGLVDELWDAGAKGIILGCTELELLVKQPDSDLPLFPCTTLHVQAALDRALA